MFLRLPSNRQAISWRQQAMFSEMMMTLSSICWKRSVFGRSRRCPLWNRAVIVPMLYCYMRNGEASDTKNNQRQSTIYRIWGELAGHYTAKDYGNIFTSLWQTRSCGNLQSVIWSITITCRFRYIIISLKINLFSSWYSWKFLI